MNGSSLKRWLVDRELCPDEKAAAALVMTGRVLVNDRPAKAGQAVGPEDRVRLKETPLPYASKGGLKLEGALRAFSVDPREKVCLDAGASTGGFTDCLLQHGARLVYAVDTGFGQLKGTLRQDSRVVNLERTNLSDPALRLLQPVPVLATCDLSYLSLRDAMPLYRQILRGGGDIIALVKPLFEVDDPEARRSGLIPEGAYAPMLVQLTDHLNSLNGMAVLDVCASPMTGNAGTIEFFLHVRTGTDAAASGLGEKITSSVHQALQTRPLRRRP